MRIHRWLVIAGIMSLPALMGCTTEGGSVESPLNEVTVIGLDYAFGGPTTLPPGLTSIAFDNRGQVDHEMILVRLNEGVTLDDVMAIAQGDGDPREVMSSGPGILIAAAGRTAESRLLVDLQPGQTYALLCNFQDEPDAEPHVALGMRAAFEVSNP